MQLHIRHETCYVYEETVSYSIQSLKLTPRAERGQRVLSWRISLPGERLEQIDPYGNLTHVVTMETPHKEMRIVVEGIGRRPNGPGRSGATRECGAWRGNGPISGSSGRRC